MARTRSWQLVLALAAILSSLPALAARAPGLTVQDLAGRREKLSDLRGKIVVLNFWATWCGPCQQELPRLRRLADAWPGKNVEFVAVSIDDKKDQPKIQPLLQRLGVVPGPGFAVWQGSSEYSMQSFGLGGVVPGTAIIGPRGNIITRIEGEARDQDVRAPVDWLLGGRQGPAPAPVIRRY